MNQSDWKRRKELAQQQERTATIDMETRYIKKGDGPEGCKFKVGDNVKTVSGNIRPYGEIVEILDAPVMGIFQLELKSGWCCHPEEYQYRGGGDRVIKIKD